MPAVDSSFVILPRFTTLVGAASFTTLPMDVSSYGGAQFQVWRGPIRTASGTGTFTVYIEESLDTEEWVLGPETSQSFVIDASDRKFFAYDFRLRWFRLRIELGGLAPIVTCWAEGLLRGGGGGLWSDGSGNAGPAGAVAGRNIDIAGGYGGYGGYPPDERQNWIAQLGYQQGLDEGPSAAFRYRPPSRPQSPAPDGSSLAWSHKK
jgi:hypothetical protein